MSRNLLVGRELREETFQGWESGGAVGIIPKGKVKPFHEEVKELIELRDIINRMYKSNGGFIPDDNDDI